MCGKTCIQRTCTHQCSRKETASITVFTNSTAHKNSSWNKEESNSTKTISAKKGKDWKKNGLATQQERCKKGLQIFTSTQHPAPSAQRPAASSQQPAGSGQQPAAASRQQTPPCAAENLVVIWRVHCGLLQSVVYCWLLLLVAAGCAAGCLLYCLLLPALLAAVLLVACCLLLSLVLVGACCWLLLLLLLVAAGCCCCCCCRCCCCCCCCLY